MPKVYITMMDRIEMLYQKSYNRYCNRVRRWVGTDNAEDVVQEAFARAIQYRRSFNPEHKKLTAWFNVILNNAARDIKKEERAQGMSSSHEELTDPMDEQMHKSELVRKVVEDMEVNDHSEVLRMFYILGYTRKEIAKVIDLTPKYIGNIVWNFRKDMVDKYGTV